MICEGCPTRDLCEIVGCRRDILAPPKKEKLPEDPWIPPPPEPVGFAEKIMKMIAEANAPLELTEDMLVSDSQVIPPKASPMPPGPPAAPVNTGELRLPNTNEAIIKEAFLGGWIVQSKDGRVALAATPEQLGKVVSDWATK